MCEFYSCRICAFYSLPAHQSLQMEIAYVGCDDEQSARHRCLFAVSLSLHVCWLEVTSVERKCCEETLSVWHLG